jgi:STAS-like domain of unknown function (DUF4325)
MKIFRMGKLFGHFLADGDLANRFRFAQVEPQLSAAQTIVFDFEGVNEATDSFMNACFAHLVADHGEEVLRKIKFKNCSRLVQHFIRSATALGLSERNKLARV